MGKDKLRAQEAAQLSKNALNYQGGSGFLKDQARKGFPGSGQLYGPKKTIDLPLYDYTNMSGKIVEIERNKDERIVKTSLPVYDSKNMSGNLVEIVTENSLKFKKCDLPVYDSRSMSGSL